MNGPYDVDCDSSLDLEWADNFDGLGGFWNTALPEPSRPEQLANELIVFSEMIADSAMDIGNFSDREFFREFSGELNMFIRMVRKYT